MKQVLFVFLLISCISVDVCSKTFGENGNLANEQTNNTYEYVDLGLSVKWATCNVGANSPEEYGSYFAWGEIATKNNYIWDTYKYGSSDVNLTKYNVHDARRQRANIDESRSNEIGLPLFSTLELSDDAARAYCRGDWRMPTIVEIDELIKNCTWEWISMNGVNGYKVTSNLNGNKIFLPAAGYCEGKELSMVGSYGYYWSNSYGLLGTSTECLFFRSNNVEPRSFRRYRGHSIRPVHP